MKNLFQVLRSNITGFSFGKFKKTKSNRPDLTNFLNNEDGSFVTIFGVSAVAIFLAMGIAVDYTQVSRAKTLVDQSLDAALLAAGNKLLNTNPSDSELRKIFEDYLYSNLSGHPQLLNAVKINSFSADQSTGIISASLDTPVTMAFMGLAGISEIPVNSSAKAKFSNSPVEISMVLDVTGSMNNGGKLASLKLAAKDAVDILLPDGGNNKDVRIGLVPYSAGVKLSKKLASKASGQNKYTCVTERNINAANDVSYKKEYVGADYRAGCSSSKVLPLTSNGSNLKNNINNYSASGYTAGHLGIAWSYYMLSENWQKLWPKKSQPSNYGGKTKKIAVLMTDGEFNTYFEGVKNNPMGSQQSKSNSDAIALCTDMKKNKKGGDGITIYSIAFNAPTSAKQTLQKCASSDSGSTTYFYDANSEAELRTAFREIAASIKTLRLTQ